MQDMLRRIEADIERAEWQEVDDLQVSGMLDLHDAKAYGGRGNAWQLFVVGRTDGTVIMATAVRLVSSQPLYAGDPNVVKLPQELAEKAYEEARNSLLAEEYFTGFSPNPDCLAVCAICGGSFSRGSVLIVLGRTKIAHQSCHEGTKVHECKGRQR